MKVSLVCSLKYLEGTEKPLTVVVDSRCLIDDRGVNEYVRKVYIDSPCTTIFKVGVNCNKGNGFLGKR
jgi:hypothetical protein